MSRSPVVRSRPGAGPATTRKMAIALTTTTVSPIGAIAVTARRRFA